MSSTVFDPAAYPPSLKDSLIMTHTGFHFNMVCMKQCFVLWPMLSGA